MIKMKIYNHSLYRKLNYIDYEGILIKHKNSRYHQKF